MPLPVPKSGSMTTGSLADRIPKIHLHCHLEGALRAATFVELGSKHGVPLRYRPSMAAAPDEAREEPEVDPATRTAFEAIANFSTSLQQSAGR